MGKYTDKSSSEHTRRKKAETVYGRPELSSSKSRSYDMFQPSRFGGMTYYSEGAPGVRIVSGPVPAVVPTPDPEFISSGNLILKVNTTAESQEIYIDINYNESQSLTIDFGNGTIQTFNSNNNDTITTVYATVGEYTITISGTAAEIYIYDDYSILTSVDDWGTLGLTLINFFSSASLSTVPNYIPSTFTSTENMFQNATIFNQDISNWDMSNVINTMNMFDGATNFNQNISSWDMSNVTNTYSMFQNATNFNQNISSWDMSNVTNTDSMFQRATNFNQDISSWDMSNVTNTSSMFQNATNFNQNISSWDMSNVTNTDSMFQRATNFNQDISSWDMSNVTDTTSMFYLATSFDQNISGWVMSSVINYSNMFCNCPSLTNHDQNNRFIPQINGNYEYACL